MCNGTGRNSHSGYRCDACLGSGVHSYLGPLEAVVAVLVSTGALMYAGYWLYLLVYGR